MQVYVLYAMSDYACAIYMSIEKHLCEQEMKQCRKRGMKCSMWIEMYDFSQSKEFNLNCD